MYALWNEWSHYQRLFPDPLEADAPSFIQASAVRPDAPQPDRVPACVQNLVRSRAGCPA